MNLLNQLQEKLMIHTHSAKEFQESYFILNNPKGGTNKEKLAYFLNKYHIIYTDADLHKIISDKTKYNDFILLINN